MRTAACMAFGDWAGWGPQRNECVEHFRGNPLATLTAAPPSIGCHWLYLRATARRTSTQTPPKDITNKLSVFIVFMLTRARAWMFSRLTTRNIYVYRYSRFSCSVMDYNHFWWGLCVCVYIMLYCMWDTVDKRRTPRHTKQTTPQRRRTCG